MRNTMTQLLRSSRPTALLMAVLLMVLTIPAATVHAHFPRYPGCCKFYRIVPRFCVNIDDIDTGKFFLPGWPADGSGFDRDQVWTVFAIDDHICQNAVEFTELQCFSLYQTGVGFQLPVAAQVRRARFIV